MLDDLQQYAVHLLPCWCRNQLL